MNVPTQKYRNNAVYGISLLIFFLSCSKDVLQLKEYVLNDQNIYVVDDEYNLDANSNIIADVLKNDFFDDLDNIIITEITEPLLGYTVINQDNTITYTHNGAEAESANEEGTTESGQESETGEESDLENEDNSDSFEAVAETDTFIYRVNITNESGAIITEQGVVTLNIKRVEEATDEEEDDTVTDEDSQEEDENDDTTTEEDAHDDAENPDDSQPINTAPVAVINADQTSGRAPLQISFSGSESTDDNKIVSYSWDFKDGNTAASATTENTFENPGTYNVVLMVSDDEGLRDTKNLVITVNEAQTGNIECGSGGGQAGESGEKVWCWENHAIPDYKNSKGVTFGNGQLRVDSECYEKQVTITGNQLKFRIEPSRPITNTNCSRDFNMRAEVRTSPWDVRHGQGTEEWFGWSYTFGNDYVIDKKNQWKFFQVHNGIVDTSPQIGLEVINEDQFNGHGAGEIYVTNSTTAQNYTPTAITPVAGQTIDIVVHVIWGDNSNGLLQVWIDGNKVYDRQISTVYSNQPWAGNAKWGIYKWPWSNSQGVQSSLEQGINHLETSMGSLRMITRKPGESDYGTDSYQRVAPN